VDQLFSMTVLNNGLRERLEQYLLVHCIGLILLKRPNYEWRLCPTISALLLAASPILRL
jgi:hypothetical protein